MEVKVKEGGEGSTLKLKICRRKSRNSMSNFQSTTSLSEASMELKEDGA